MKEETEHIISAETEGVEGTKTNDNYIQLARRGLVRLFLGGELKSSSLVSEENRCLVSRATYCGYAIDSNLAKFTLGGILEANSEYFLEAFNRSMGDKSEMSLDEFLASFLKQLLHKNSDGNEALQIAKHIETFNKEHKKIWSELITSYLYAHQIPAENVFLALGIHILQKAHDQKLIAFTRGEDRKWYIKKI